MLALFEDELSANQKAIKNLMTAIEQGIITDTTKSRLVELENEQVKIKANIEREKRDIPKLSRKDIIAGLAMFRDGDINDKKYQASLFNTFLVAVYVYDDRLEIVFSHTKDKSAISVPFDLTASEAGEKTQAGKVRLKSASLHQKTTY